MTNLILMQHTLGLYFAHGIQFLVDLFDAFLVIVQMLPYCRKQSVKKKTKMRETLDEGRLFNFETEMFPRMNTERNN